MWKCISLWVDVPNIPTEPMRKIIANVVSDNLSIQVREVFDGEDNRPQEATESIAKALSGIQTTTRN